MTRTERVIGAPSGLEGVTTGAGHSGAANGTSRPLLVVFAEFPLKDCQGVTHGIVRITGVPISAHMTPEGVDFGFSETLAALWLPSLTVREHVDGSRSKQRIDPTAPEESAGPRAGSEFHDPAMCRFVNIEHCHGQFRLAVAPKVLGDLLLRRDDHTTCITQWV